MKRGIKRWLALALASSRHVFDLKFELSSPDELATLRGELDFKNWRLLLFENKAEGERGC